MPWEAETTLELLLASRSTTQLPTSGLQGTRWYIHIPSLIHFNVLSQRQPRSAAAGVVLGKQIFIMGGEGRSRPGVVGRPLMSVECLDVPSGSWKKVK